MDSVDIVTLGGKRYLIKDTTARTLIKQNTRNLVTVMGGTDVNGSIKYESNKVRTILQGNIDLLTSRIQAFDIKLESIRTSINGNTVRTNKEVKYNKEDESLLFETTLALGPKDDGVIGGGDTNNDTPTEDNTNSESSDSTDTTEGEITTAAESDEVNNG